MMNLKFLSILLVTFTSLSFALIGNFFERANTLSQDHIIFSEKECAPFYRQLSDLSKEKGVRFLYGQAYTLTGDGQLLLAEKASKCAAILDHGSPEWKFSAESVAKMLHLNNR